MISMLARTGIPNLGREGAIPTEGEHVQPRLEVGGHADEIDDREVESRLVARVRLAEALEPGRGRRELRRRPRARVVVSRMGFARLVLRKRESEREEVAV